MAWTTLTNSTTADADEVMGNFAYSYQDFVPFDSLGTVTNNQFNLGTSSAIWKGVYANSINAASMILSSTLQVGGLMTLSNSLDIYGNYEVSLYNSGTVNGNAVYRGVNDATRWDWGVYGNRLDYWILYNQTVNTYTIQVTPQGNVSIGPHTPSTTLDVAGSGAFTGNLVVSGTLNVSGQLTLSNSLVVQGNQINIIGSMTVSGNIVLSGTFIGSGAMTLSNSLALYGNFEIGLYNSGTLDGNAVYRGVNDATRWDWGVYGNRLDYWILYNQTVNTYTIQVTPQGNVSIGPHTPSATLDVNGTVAITGNQNTNGNISATGQLSLAGQPYFRGFYEAGRGVSRVLDNYYTVTTASNTGFTFAGNTSAVVTLTSGIYYVEVAAAFTQSTKAPTFTTWVFQLNVGGTNYIDRATTDNDIYHTYIKTSWIVQIGSGISINTNIIMTNTNFFQYVASTYTTVPLVSYLQIVKLF